MRTVLAFGTYDARKHQRIGILIEGLRRNGCTVDEINHPLGLSTSQRVDILKKPWKLFGFAWRILTLWRQLKREARQWMAKHGKPDAVVVGYMGHFDVLLARHVFRNVPIMLDHLIFAGDTAKDRGAKGLKVTLLNYLDHLATHAADLVVVDTLEHEHMLEEDVESMVIPVGASDEWYAAQGRTPTSEREGVVFYGLYTPLQGTPVIAQALVELSHRGVEPKVTMIGNGQDYEQVRTLTDGLNAVTFLEWVEPEELPAMVASHAVALGIFSDTPKGLHVVPNKVYQSMAAGCAVITSDTAPQRRMLGNGAVLVQPNDAKALADAITRLLTDSGALADASAAAVASAEQFRPETICRKLSEWISARVEDNR
ncbi:glycosyltransferase [Bifidobacterium pullorum]|uniref:glycosyltransferase n=1 Tax=Bifidobacterium pullorum TaxID=78448 RepID=UPI0025A46845|nr:glycosyltransferase [Bifidobacterium pullorum]MDM8322793.1 glycosyltransferase [Bifidobacterium pullorum]